jgi:hypothetical protein
MLGGHTGLNSTHAKSCSLNLDGAVVALSLLPIISPHSLRMYGCLILTFTSWNQMKLRNDEVDQSLIFGVGEGFPNNVFRTDGRVAPSQVRRVESPSQFRNMKVHRQSILKSLLPNACQILSAVR